MEKINKISDIKTRNDLAKFLNIPISKFTYILYVKKTENYYKSFDIPKKNGGVRHINAPLGDLKEIQRKLADALWIFKYELIKNNKIQANVSQAFEKKKGIITNAIIHRNKRFILNIDLENFFDSFHFGRVKGYFEKNRYLNLPKEVATIIAQLTCYNGCLPQGAPSSPIITNLICSILDMRLVKIAHRYKLDYSRYADDMTFSTNDIKFTDHQQLIIDEISKEINKFGFSINVNKTRIIFKDSRQEVTGLVVNKKVNVNKDYYKKTRAMSDSLYKNGEFYLNGYVGTIKQLEGRFSFINQLDHYNNKLDDSKKHNFRTLNSREKQYQAFLFYKYFFANSKPLVITEGKTDIVYLKAALKKHHSEYPKLIAKKGDKFNFRVSFLRRTERLEYFLGIQQDGADTMKNIYNFYSENKGVPNLYKNLSDKSSLKSINPVILIFDNERESDRPLKKFINCLKPNEKLVNGTYKNIINNLYLLTNPLVKGMNECEIEDLFDNTVLTHSIGEKTFSREKDYDKDKYYGKAIFSQYIASNYETINFCEFKPMLEDLNKIISDMEKQG